MMVERAERILERGVSLREALGRALCGGQTASFDALSGGHWVGDRDVSAWRGYP